MTENTNLQIQVLRDLLTTVESASIPIWFYGGYALDALEGRALRAHKDIDIIVALEDQYRLRTELSVAGFEIVEQGMHYTVFVKSDQYVEVLTFKRLADGVRNGVIFPYTIYSNGSRAISYTCEIAAGETSIFIVLSSSGMDGF